LGTPEFKKFLTQEARREGISLSQLIRQRCERKPPDEEDRELWAALIQEIRAAALKANLSLKKGLADAEKVLAEMRKVA